MVSEQDLKVISQCIRAATDGPFFPDLEFQTLFGFEKDEVRELVENFSSEVLPTKNYVVVVCNTFTNLLGYPHGQFAQWPAWVSVPPEEAKQVFERWCSVYVPV